MIPRHSPRSPPRLPPPALPPSPSYLLAESYYPGYCMNRDGPIIPLAFPLARSSSSDYYETRFQREDEAEGESGGGRGAGQSTAGWDEAVENVGRVPARHCHFHRLAAFPRLFLHLLHVVLLAGVSCLLHPREKPAAMKIRWPFISPRSVHRTYVHLGVMIRSICSGICRAGDGGEEGNGRERIAGSRPVYCRALY